jgi:quercetin dioxygenase-like cupin family protein
MFRKPSRPEMKPLHIPAGGGKAVNILGIPIFIRVHGLDTHGTLAVVESHDEPGGGPPPHIHHREDETFQILEGEYEFTVADKTIRARAGDTLFAPRDIPHTYRCVSEGGGRLSVVLTPAGFENFFAEVGAMTAEEQQNIPRVIEIAGRHGLEFLPPQ